MSGSAIIMMIIAMVVIWGGLALAVLNLTRFRGQEPKKIQREL